MRSNPLATLPVKQLKAALAIREKIQRLEKALSRLSIGLSFPPAASGKEFGFRVGKRSRTSATPKPRRRSAKTSKSAAAKSRRSSPRGHLKQRIIRALMAAGKRGVTIQDLSQKLGTKYGNISVWFHTTGKGVKEVKKIGPGKYAWSP